MFCFFLAIPDLQSIEAMPSRNVQVTAKEHETQLFEWTTKNISPVYIEG